jgi:hypothetical protein
MAQTTVTTGPVIRIANHYLTYCLFLYTAYCTLAAVRNCSNTNVPTRLTRSLIPTLTTKSSRADLAVCVESDGIAVCAGSLSGQFASNTVQEEMRLITVYLKLSEEHRLGCQRAWC